MSRTEHWRYSTLLKRGTSSMDQRSLFYSVVSCVRKRTPGIRHAMVVGRQNTESCITKIIVAPFLDLDFSQFKTVYYTVICI